LDDCKSPSLSADWRLSIAHNSALMSATVALAASGYRASHEAYHFRVLQSLRYTLLLDTITVARLDAFRKKRNITGYERAGAVSDQEADEMIELAEDLRQQVEAWLQANHPGLV